MIILNGKLSPALSAYGLSCWSKSECGVININVDDSEGRAFNAADASARSGWVPGGCAKVNRDASNLKRSYMFYPAVADPGAGRLQYLGLCKSVGARLATTTYKPWRRAAGWSLGTYFKYL